jgi:hypothetical protein
MLGLKSISICDRHLAKLKITVSFDGHHFTLFLTKKSSTSHASRRGGRFSSIQRAARASHDIHAYSVRPLLARSMLSDLGYQDEVISIRSRCALVFVNSSSLLSKLVSSEHSLTNVLNTIPKWPCEKKDKSPRLLRVLRTTRCRSAEP